MIEWLIPLATAALGGYMGQKQQEAQDRARKDQALINMYSPLFGGAPQALPMAQNYQAPGMIQGALTGYSLMNSIQDNARKEKEAMALADAVSTQSQQAGSRDVFIPYAVQEPIMSQGVADSGPFTYRPYNPFVARNPYGG